MTPKDAVFYDLAQNFDGGNSWQAGFYQLIEPLTKDQALWKPSPDRHSIWDVLVHVNYWKQYATDLVYGREKKPTEDGNWTLAPKDPSEMDWQNTIAQTKKIHENFQQAAQDMGDALFNFSERKSNYVRQLFYHDAYHAGQIGLLRVMQGLKPIE